MHKNLINIFFKKLNSGNNPDLIHFFDFYSNKGLQKIFTVFFQEKSDKEILKSINQILQSVPQFDSHYQRKEFSPFIFLKEYQLMTGKTKEDAVDDLFFPNIKSHEYLDDIKNDTDNYNTNSRVILDSIKKNPYFSENIAIIDKFYTIISNAFSIIGIEQIKDMDLQEKIRDLKDYLQSIEFGENDSMYFQSIKTGLLKTLSQQKLNEQDNLYFVLVLSYLEKFKNNDFYLLFNDFIDKNDEILQILEREKSFDNTDISLGNAEYSAYRNLHDLIRKKSNLFIFDLKKNILFKNEDKEEDYKFVHRDVIQENIIQFLGTLSEINQFLKNKNYDFYLDYVSKRFREEETFSKKEIVSLLIIIPEIFEENHYILKQFEHFYSVKIFDYFLNSKTENLLPNHNKQVEKHYKKNEATDMQTHHFEDELSGKYQGELLEQFIQDCLNLIKNSEYNLNLAISHFNPEVYESIQKNYRQLKSNCLLVDLKNLSEPYFWLEELIGHKIKSQTLLNINEKKIIDLINMHFIQLTEGFKQGHNRIGTPNLIIYKKLEQAFTDNYFIKFSPMFVSNHSDIAEIRKLSLQQESRPEIDYSNSIKEQEDTFSSNVFDDIPETVEQIATTDEPVDEIETTDETLSSENNEFIEEINNAEDLNQSTEEFNQVETFDENINLSELSETGLEDNSFDDMVFDQTVPDEQTETNENEMSDNFISTKEDFVSPPEENLPIKEEASVTLPEENLYTREEISNYKPVSNIEHTAVLPVNQQVIVFDGSKNGYIIKGKHFVSAENWILNSNNINMNLNSIYEYNEICYQSLTNDEETEINIEILDSYFSNLINDLENIHLNKTVELLYALKSYLFYMSNMRMPYDYNTYLTTKKTVDTLILFLIDKNPDYNYEDYDNLFGLIGFAQKNIESVITNYAFRSNMENMNAIRQENQAISLKQDKTIELFANYENEFAKFSTKIKGSLNKLNEIQIDIKNDMEHSAMKIESISINSENGFKTVNSNLQKIFKTIVDSEENEKVSGSGGKGIISGFFNKS